MLYIVCQVDAQLEKWKVNTERGVRKYLHGNFTEYLDHQAMEQVALYCKNISCLCANHSLGFNAVEGT